MQMLRCCWLADICFCRRTIDGEIIKIITMYVIKKKKHNSLVNLHTFKVKDGGVLLISKQILDVGGKVCHVGVFDIPVL